MASDQVAPGRPRRVPWWAIAGISALTFLLDLLSKQWALRALADGTYSPVLGKVFGFELVFNPGAAFSFASGATWVFTIIAVIVTIVIIRVSLRLRSWWWGVTLAMLLGGTIGNLADRLFRDPGFGVGHVVDFLNYNGFFVGNVADVFIVAAAILLTVLAFLGIPLDGHPDGGGPGSRPESPTDPEGESGARGG